MESLAQDPARSFDSSTLHQCVVVLFERAPELSALRPLLQRYPMTGEGPLGLSLSMKPELDGEIRVEIVAAPFPDDGPAEVWSSQPFGALATVGALARATQHAWTFPEAAELVGRHRAFVRVATVPAPIPDVGARASEPASADGAVIALLSATEIASALCEAPGALCVFNPAGEALRSPEVVRDALRECGARHLPPLELWANVRIFELGGTDWVVMDTIGMAQLGVGDHEACFAREQYDFEVIDAFLRDTTYSELVSHRRMVDGDAVDGPGELHGSRALAQVLPGTLATTSARPGSLPWRGQSVAAGLGSPKRGVLRWLPLDGRTPPARLA